MESIEKLRTAARNMAKGMNLEEYEECNLLLVIADEIERDIVELQKSWTQEAREHANESVKLAELAYENADLKRKIIEALTALASALSWTQPNCTSSVSSYLKDAWAAIDKLKEDSND